MDTKCGSQWDKAAVEAMGRYRDVLGIHCEPSQVSNHPVEVVMMVDLAILIANGLTSTGMTQEELSEESGVSLWTIRQALKLNAHPGLSDIIALFGTLGIRARIVDESTASAQAEHSHK